MLKVGSYVERVGKYWLEVGVLMIKDGKEKKLPIALCDNESNARLTRNSLDLLFLLLKEELNE